MRDISNIKLLSNLREFDQAALAWVTQKLMDIEDVNTSMLISSFRVNKRNKLRDEPGKAQRLRRFVRDKIDEEEILIDEVQGENRVRKRRKNRPMEPNPE